MTAGIKKEFDKVFLHLEKFGLLLLSDSALPNVSRIVAGEKISGSWWSHEAGQKIFLVGEMLEDHPDVMIMKLVSNKVTFVHRELWGHVYAIGVAREDWQLRNLSLGAKRLLQALDDQGLLQTNKLGKEFGPKPSDTARELESRLLIHANQIHTESGAHAKVIETWPAWAKRVGFRAKAKSPGAARRFLDQRLAEMNKEFGGNGKLPWPADA
ncbi:MAG TPA: hypothetical protein VFT48_13615 [Pyrinomonadaceae bacterium]|nr:hypothetical protein [Pyrinomonadaceae bacterium]